MNERCYPFSELIGEYVWSVRRSADEVLRMDFGLPHLVIREPISRQAGSTQPNIQALDRRIVLPTGKWHLFIENGEWNIISGQRSCSRIESDSTNKDITISHLDGQKLAAVNYYEESKKWVFHFDLNGILSINSSEPNNQDCWKELRQWVLFFENSGYIAYTNQGKFEIKS